METVLLLSNNVAGARRGIHNIQTVQLYVHENHTHFYEQFG
jgi:hypothetical protein